MRGASKPGRPPAIVQPDKPKRVHWVAELTTWIRSHLFSGVPGALETIPGCDVQSHSEIVLEGSPNQKWLQAACGVLTGDQRWVDFAIRRYADELREGHLFSECLTSSHRWQYLTAHAAIRWAVMFTGFVKKLDHVSELHQANDLWWDHEATLLVMFYSHDLRRCISVGARNDPAEPGNFATSTEADAFAAFFAHHYPVIRQPRNAGSPDTWCRELGERLRVAASFNLVRTDVVPRLVAPVHVSTRGPLRSWWTPPDSVSRPSYRAEVVGDKPRFWFSPSQPDDKDSGDWKTIGQ